MWPHKFSFQRLPTHTRSILYLFFPLPHYLLQYDSSLPPYMTSIPSGREERKTERTSEGDSGKSENYGEEDDEADYGDDDEEGGADLPLHTRLFKMLGRWFRLFWDWLKSSPVNWFIAFLGFLVVAVGAMVFFIMIGVKVPEGQKKGNFGLLLSHSSRSALSSLSTPFTLFIFIASLLTLFILHTIHSSHSARSSRSSHSSHSSRSSFFFAFLCSSRSSFFIFPCSRTTLTNSRVLLTLIFYGADVWLEVGFQILNAIFTIAAVCTHPLRTIDLYRAWKLRSKPLAEERSHLHLYVASSCSLPLVLLLYLYHLCLVVLFWRFVEEPLFRLDF